MRNSKEESEIAYLHNCKKKITNCHKGETTVYLEMFPRFQRDGNEVGLLLFILLLGISSSFSRHLMIGYCWGQNQNET